MFSKITYKEIAEKIMRVKLLSLFGAGLLLLSSCSKEKDLVTAETSTVSFTGKINNLQATTNTGPNTYWSPNDQIGVFMVNAGTTTITDNSSNKQYQYIGGKFNPISGNELFYPVNNDRVDFIAYYPYKAEYDLGTAVVLNLGDQTDLSKIDLLYAKTHNSGQGFNKTTGLNVPLIFDHALSKIIIKPVEGVGMNSLDPSWINMDVTIQGINSICNFDLKTGTVSSVSSPVVITPFKHIAGSSYEAIVIPSTYTAAGSLSFSFTIAGNTYVWNSPSHVTYEPGKEYTYTITVNKIGVVLDNVLINDWFSVYRAGTAN